MSKQQKAKKAAKQIVKSPLVGALQPMVLAEPCQTLVVFSVITPEQWAFIVSGQAEAHLREELLGKAQAALRKYPQFIRDDTEDVAGEALLKLAEARFLENYRPEKSHPMVYILGCGFNFSRVLARSIWRRYKREHGVNDVDTL